MFFPSLDDIATRDVLTIDFQASVREAIDMMYASNHRNIIVTNGTLFYLLTTADLIALKLDDIDFSRPLSSLELRQVPSLSGEENVINAIDLVSKEHEYICLTDSGNRLLGIVTNSDIVASIDPQIMFEKTSLQSLFETHHNYTLVQGSGSMNRAIKMMKSSRQDCIIIAEGKTLAGIVTSKDILRFFSDFGEERPVSYYMSSPLHTLPASTSIKDALAYVTEKHFKRIVVTDESGALVGIISQQDLIAQTYLRWSKLIQEHYDEIEELTQILEQKNRQLIRLATKDRLTGIDNRHTFEEQFEREHDYAKRYRIPLHLMILDVDHFKQVNDTYGHLIGDSVLKEFSTLVRYNSRSSDLFARWGGEEFVLMLRNCSDGEAKRIAEKLCRSVAAHDFEKVGTLTCSIGLCRVNPDTPLCDSLAKADQALYSAKSEGRNRVCTYSEA
jgi:diguanylate cyclase (GGDEF)-like protein